MLSYTINIYCSKTNSDEAEESIPIVVKGDSWFGSVKAAAAIAEKDMHCILQVKTSHRLFPKSYIEDALANSPGGVHIVLKGRHPNGKTLIAMGYRYS